MEFSDTSKYDLNTLLLLTIDLFCFEYIDSLYEGANYFCI